jgi:MoaA/NifB/PqqE/SkfB family radical SAM enzyme
MLDRFVRECAEAGTHKVVLGETGEPTIHPHFDQLLDLIVQLRMSPVVMTNGIAVDERRVRTWAGKEALYRFSLHAGDVETWLRIHPAGTAAQWERLSRVIETLVRSGTSTVVTMHVLQKANYRNIQKMIEHAHRHGVRQILFSPVRATGSLAPVLLTAEEEEWVRHELRRCTPLAESLGIQTNARQYLQTGGYVESGQLQTASVFRHLPCYVGWLQAFLLADGTVAPCDGSSRNLGQAAEQSLMAIWRSPQYQSFRREAITLPARGKPVEGCLCDHCSLVGSSLKARRLLRLGLARSRLV